MQNGTRANGQYSRPKIRPSTRGKGGPPAVNGGARYTPGSPCGAISTISLRETLRWGTSQGVPLVVTNAERSGQSDDAAHGATMVARELAREDAPRAPADEAHALTGALAQIEQVLREPVPGRGCHPEVAPELPTVNVVAQLPEQPAEWLGVAVPDAERWQDEHRVTVTTLGRVEEREREEECAELEEAAPLHRQQRRFPEAEPLLLAGYEGLRTKLGPTDTRTRAALTRLVALYDAWGKRAEAQTYRKLLTP